METADASGANNSSIQHCSCYKVATLEATVLESTQISNLNDHYILKEQLGWGQFGVIRACSDKLTGEVLACKSIAKDRLVTPDDVRSVKLEIEIMARLSGHPNIVNLRAVYEEENYVHLLMELCMGGELFHLLEKLGRFSETEARFLFKHLMEVVKYCHDNGVIHRDLKPENILLVSTSPDSPIKLADFGLATYIKPGQYLRGTVGSPFYIAPEVLAGGYNEAADVWSAGVILYILLSGMPPFWGKTKSKIFDAVRAANLRFPASHWDRISASAKDLIAGMLRVDPSKRLTAAEVLAHSWMENPEEAIEQPPMLDGLRQIMPEVGIGSFSALSVTRIQDYSFNYGSSEAVDDVVDQSPTFSCKSSFSSFFVGNETPPAAFTGFSFSCELTSSLDFSSPIPSMASFTFFSPGSAVEQQNDLPGINSSVSDADTGKTGSGLVGKLFKLQDSQVCFKHETEQEPRTETREKRTRIAWIQSRRNHTIGFGEHNQIDITVTESVIRWASCTHIPTAPSLRLSLVC